MRGSAAQGTTPSCDAAAETAIDQAGAPRIGIKGDWSAAGAGDVWLSADTGIYRLDPASGRQTALSTVATAIASEIAENRSEAWGTRVIQENRGPYSARHWVIKNDGVFAGFMLLDGRDEGVVAPARRRPAGDQGQSSA